MSRNRRRKHENIYCKNTTSPITDLGLRNARLNFRQQEETHIVENIIYNELRLRGYLVDVGIVEINEKQADGKYSRKQTGIDFVVNKDSRRYYVQSAFVKVLPFI